MLIQKWEKELTKSKCNPKQEGVHCIIHVDGDLTEVIPYLNAELGGDFCSQDPPYVTFKIYGKLLTVHPHKIAINALKDEEEANKVANWIVGEINRIWENKDKITPTYEIPKKPQPIEILKRLPKTNCQKCGCPTCLVFATHICEGIKTLDDCPEIEENKKKDLQNYLKNFKFKVVDTL